MPPSATAVAQAELGTPGLGLGLGLGPHGPGWCCQVRCCFRQRAGCASCARVTPLELSWGSVLEAAVCSQGPRLPGNSFQLFCSICFLCYSTCQSCVSLDLMIFAQSALSSLSVFSFSSVLLFSFSPHAGMEPRAWRSLGSSFPLEPTSVPWPQVPFIMVLTRLGAGSRCPAPCVFGQQPSPCMCFLSSLLLSSGESG